MPTLPESGYIAVGESSQYTTYSVTALTAAMKGLLEKTFYHIHVEGEISGFKRYPSGHVYFTLKDQGAQISAVMFSRFFEACKVRAMLKDGAKVHLYATASMYAQRGSCQLNVIDAKLVGLGDLMQRYLELKAKLQAEGIFDLTIKKQLPKFPRKIGIVTSEAGAVIHDMCNVLQRRFPALEIRLFPSLVQGEGAAESIIRGIEYFNSVYIPDLLIIARGGGSFEDLFCFNDETLVRAVRSSKVPTISAVGHESDFTLCDFAADKRAGTPSIAAEMAVPVLAEIEERISNSCNRQRAALRAKGDSFAQHIDRLSFELMQALKHAFILAENRLDSAKRSLFLLSPYAVLERGYSLTTSQDGAIVKNADSLKAGDKISTRFALGSVTSIVE